MIKTIVEYVNFYYARLHPPKTPRLKEYSEDVVKTALVFRFLYEHYVKDTLDLETIIYKLDCCPIRSNSRVIRNHLIFHRAFKSFRRLYKAGRGCVYLFDCSIKSEVIGYLTGIIYWIFHKGII